MTRTSKCMVDSNEKCGTKKHCTCHKTVTGTKQITVKKKKLRGKILKFPPKKLAATEATPNKQRRDQDLTVSHTPR